MTEELEKAQGLLASGDIADLLRYLRTDGGALPLGEVARLVAGAARLAGLDDLAQAAAAVADGGNGSGTEDARALYDFGYACTDRGADYLAVRPLARALELASDAGLVLSELVAALEADGQHAWAVAVLEEHEPVMGWLHRFQYVYNALMAGSLDKAPEGFGRLPEPEDTAWRPAREKVRRMLARADTVRAVTSLDRRDLRGWHYVLTGGVLASLSRTGSTRAYRPLGVRQRLRRGLRGRAAAAALQRPRLILDAAGTRPAGGGAAARQALQSGRREYLTAQLETRQQQERRAEEDQRNRNCAATLVTEAGAACELPVDSPEVTAATLEKWLAQRSECMAEVDETRRQAAELEALLSGRTLGDLTQEAETASLKATQLAAQADRHLLAEVDPATAAERIPALRSSAREANKHSAEALGELRQFTASVTSVAEAEEALEAAEAGLRRVEQLKETLDLTCQLLEEAQNRVHRDIAPVIAATLKEWLPTITGGRYTDVTVNPGTLRIDVCGPSRRWRRAELLSHGTAEQIYLLLRIALADHLTKSHDTCPLILDDVTVHADAARKNEILAVLLKIAERRQIIIFTQEQQTAGWARERLSAPGHAIRTLSSLPAI